MSKEELEEVKGDIERINKDLISTSLSDARCSKHSNVEEISCEDCASLLELVKTFQTHHCTFSCKKKKKYIHILPGQGLGINEPDSIEIITHVCRFKFPRFPIDRNIVLLPISKNEDPKAADKMRRDLKHIKAYLIRKTYFFVSKENEAEWMKFKNMTFEEYLCDLGMFEEIPASETEENRLKLAKERYYNALRAEISGSGFVFLKRNPCDVFTNNYNKMLLLLLKCNHDLQYIFDQFSCANYTTAYMAKIEAGLSHLLRLIEKEMAGMHQFEIMKVFGNIIDRHRELSIQEAIYRLLGLPMSKFSRKVKYLNCSHPIMRDGLVKSNWQSLEEDDPVFHMSVHEYYEDCPDDIEFDDMCLADFQANFERSKTETSTSIPLLNDHGFINRRSKPAVLRYYLNHDDLEELARGLLILFFPFRSEMEDIHNQNVLDLFNENKDMIEEKRQEYEKNIHLVELIEEIARVQDENPNDNEALEEDEPEIERNPEDETTSEKDVEDFVKTMKAVAINKAKKENDDIPSIMNLRERIILLNTNQRIIFDDLCERMIAPANSYSQFCLYISGEAGKT